MDPRSPGHRGKPSAPANAISESTQPIPVTKPFNQIGRLAALMDRPLARAPGGRVYSYSEFVAQASAIADALPDRRYVINFCEDRYLFAAAFAAALARTQITLLPADRSPRSLELLSPDFSEAVLLTDTPASAAHGRSIFQIRLERQPLPHGQLMRPIAPPEQPAVIAFTSGSTGAPEPHPRTWGSLCGSAWLIQGALQLPHDATIVATVPPQHMYGLELSVLLPIVCDLTLHSAKPFFPADVAAALWDVPPPRVLVTTPVHLRVLSAATVEFPPLELLVSATAPLTPKLAECCEQRFGARILEIYGCTETGSIASRRTINEPPDWHLFTGITFTKKAGVCVVQAPHLFSPVELADRIDSVDAHRFRLEGRGADLVNIAGKRHSLGALNTILTEIDGVLDGAFYVPDETEPGQHVRPLAFVVAPHRSAEDVAAALRAQLDPVFMPRQIHLLKSLPRNQTGKLTRQALCELHRQLSNVPVSAPCDES